MRHGKRVDLAGARDCAPLDGLAAGIDAHGPRIVLEFLCHRAVLQQQASLARGLPEWPAEAGWFRARALPRIGRHIVVHAAPSRTITALMLQLRIYGIEPIPVTMALRGFATCRAPPSPRSCRTASTKLSPPPASPA